MTVAVFVAVENATAGRRSYGIIWHSPELPGGGHVASGLSRAYDSHEMHVVFAQRTIQDERMPEFFYVLINYPVFIAAPITVFAALAMWSHSRTAWFATAAWVAYLVYELGMKAGEFCSGIECTKRTPLYVVYPLLALLSLVALVQVYIHLRDKHSRHRRT